jgi:hypothetical protein
VIVVHPVVPLPRQLVRGVRRLLGWDLQEFFVTYPIWARYPQAELYHLTSQNLATLLLLRSPPGPTVVTVHDIIPWLVRKDPELRTYEHFAAEFFDRLALRGLCQADVLIVVSEYTRQTLSELRTGSAGSVAAS